MQSELSISQELLWAYEAVKPGWMLAMWTAGRGLFTLLAIIDFASATTWLAIERRSIEEWASGMLRIVIRIGIFYTLLVYGADWIAAIVTTFQELGQRGAGLSGIAPDTIMTRGVNITFAGLASASAWGILFNHAAVLVHVFCAVVAGLSFALIGIGYVVLMVEAFACLTAGYIFLAFGGSRWTVPYVERYIALSVAIGVKYLLFYFLIAVGMNLSTTWAESFAAMAGTGTPGMGAFVVMIQSLTFLMLCWQIPKLFSTMLGGSPNLTMGDMVSTSIATVGAAIAAPFAAARVGGAAIAAGKSIAGAGGGSSAAGSIGGGSSAGASWNGWSGGRAPSSGGLPAGYHIPPPSESSGGSGGSRGGSSAGRWAGRAARMPGDHAPQAQPPRLQMGDGEKE